MAKVVLTAEAREDVRDLDGDARKKVLRAMKKLETSPDQRGAPLGSRSVGDLTTFRKLVVGDRDYRIIYRVERDGTVCVVWVVGHRADRECYDLATARLKLYSNERQTAELQHILDLAWEPRPTKK